MTRSLIICTIFFILGCQRTSMPSIHVYCAASTGPLLKELAETYEQNHGLRIVVNAGASSTLARQIHEGAPAHIYITAKSDWMDYLETKNLIKAQSRRTWLANDLVLFSRNDEHKTDLDILYHYEGLLAIGDPSHVPGGVYGHQALQSMGVASVLEPRYLKAANIKDAVRLVALGEAELGIAYASDIHAQAQFKVLGIFPESGHDPILYEVGMIENAPDQAQAFLNELWSVQTKAKMADFGFRLPED